MTLGLGGLGGLPLYLLHPLYHSVRRDETRKASDNPLNRPRPSCIEIVHRFDSTTNVTNFKVNIVKLQEMRDSSSVLRTASNARI